MLCYQFLMISLTIFLPGALLEWAPWVLRNPQNFEVHYCGTLLNPHAENPVLHSGTHKLKLLTGPLSSVKFIQLPRFFDTLHQSQIKI